MAMIEAAGLTKYYGKYMSIESVGFTVEKGEIFGIVGAEDDGDRHSCRRGEALFGQRVGLRPRCGQRRRPAQPHGARRFAKRRVVCENPRKKRR